MVIGRFSWVCCRMGFKIVDERDQRWEMALLVSPLRFAPFLAFDARQYFSNFHLLPVMMVSSMELSPMVAMHRTVAAIVVSCGSAITPESFRLVLFSRVWGCWNMFIPFAEQTRSSHLFHKDRMLSFCLVPLVGAGLLANAGWHGIVRSGVSTLERLGV